jgi:hypothetical protein
MAAIHDRRCTHQMPKRLKITAMALGLVRLLQDTGRIEEARTTLDSLANGFRGSAEDSGKPRQKSCKTSRLKGVTKAAPCSPASTRIDTAETRPQALSTV